MATRQNDLWDFLLANGVPRGQVTDALRWWRLAQTQTGATDDELRQIVATVAERIDHPWNPARMLGRRGTIERYLNPLRRNRKAGSSVGTILNELARRG